MNENREGLKLLAAVPVLAILAPAFIAELVDLGTASPNSRLLSDAYFALRASFSAAKAGRRASYRMPALPLKLRA